MEEYDKALTEPAHAVFRVIDANADNQISLAELQRAEQILADQIQRLRVPEPSNSLSHQVQKPPVTPSPCDSKPRSLTAPADGRSARRLFCEKEGAAIAWRVRCSRQDPSLRIRFRGEGLLFRASGVS